MSYLLDTNICIYLMNGRFPNVEARLFTLAPSDVNLSSIVVSELMFGAANSQHLTRNRQTLDVFLSGFTILPYGEKEAVAYGDIRAKLKQQGTPIGAADTFIAAHAKANELILVTNNTKQFQHVPGLQVENWLD